MLVPNTWLEHDSLGNDICLVAQQDLVLSAIDVDVVLDVRLLWLAYAFFWLRSNQPLCQLILGSRVYHRF
jgi:hypothetical protein